MQRINYLGTSLMNLFQHNFNLFKIRLPFLTARMVLQKTNILCHATTILALKWSESTLLDYWTFLRTLMRDADGEFLGECGEELFSRCRAVRVCFHPGATFPVAIQGQKYLCCLIGSNSNALPNDTPLE